jgi:uncharacterized protein
MEFESYFEISIIILLLCIFLAGFIDAIAGGGGLISIPVLMMVFPSVLMPNIIGTNRFSSFLGTSIAAYQYNRNNKAKLSLILYAGIPASLMAALGAYCSHYIPNHYYKPIVIILLLIVILISLFKKDFGNNTIEKDHHNETVIAILIGALIGFYNGLVGPGTGTFLLFGLVSIMGYNLLQASAAAKILNAIVDISSLLYFIIQGAVIFKLAIPMAICNMLGAYAGSKLAIMKGNKVIKYVFLLVSFILVVKLSIDYFNIQ